MSKFSFKGRLQTDPKGVQQLFDFYKFAKQYSNCWFTIDFEQLEWFDANLSSELLLYCYNLKKNNNLKFFIDYSILKGDLNVLSRNGFAYYVVHNKEHFKPVDDRETVIPIKAFQPDNVDSFADYIENIFLKQRGLDKIDKDSKDRIKSSYFEIFDNVGIHANTKSPIICCGQHFPVSGELKFTLTDYGDGFLKKIAQHTLNEIKSGAEAISWAVKGGSTKPDAIKGGNGLKKIMMYCFKNGGELSIVSDGCFWSLQNKSINSQNLNNCRAGATIHLTFRYLN
ncbi:MAG TPA: hypothetical protein PLJ42_00020 [Chitinophagales bacterium]|nr:hypothetical protein [Chitinophagales bacterium]HQW77784.1 hypothetical protein [Chitinophagales bacterium]